MIVQEFFEDGNKILTIVHEKMDEGIENRSLNDSISIDGHIISFKEYFVNKSLLTIFHSILTDFILWNKFL